MLRVYLRVLCRGVGYTASASGFGFGFGFGFPASGRPGFGTDYLFLLLES